MNEDSIFLEALKVGPAEARQAFLDQACGGNAELRAAVERLVSAHERAGDFLDGKAAGLPATVAPSVTERIGMPIGPYKLLEQIGEGGFGVVFMAEQLHPLRRRVAVKVLKAGMDTQQVVARFEQERQALALMDHPHIAKVLDGGTTPAGRPFFVMELIRGVPVTQYCDEHQLGPRERLELFVPICQAVQHAHQKGIIHRDLKPSNVLVTMHDGRPLVKVIDFGVAKATGQQLTEKTLFTNFAQMVGTPLYMSPEQAELTSQDIDTRTDIYSLGVLLYELLTGTTPFERKRFQEAAFDEIRRIIREEEPPRPSLRLSSLGDTLPSVSALRNTEPRKLRQLMRGDLDWIVMKALEKDRTRRYETANGLARDVQRYLDDEPVEACPPSATYRFTKFARRNRAALVTTAFIAASLVAGMAISTWQAVRAWKAENLAHLRLEAETEARQEAERATKGEFEQRQLALQNGARAEANFREARGAVRQMLTRVAEERLIHIPQMEGVRRDLFEDAIQFYERASNQSDVDPDVRFEAGEAHLRAANIERTLSDNDAAAANCRAAIRLFESIAHGPQATPQYRAALADALFELGAFLNTAASPSDDSIDEKETVLQRGVKVLRELIAEFPAEPLYRGKLANGLRVLANHWMYRYRRQHDEARHAEARQALLESQNLCEQLVASHPDVPDHLYGLALTHHNLGKVAALRPDLAAAEREFRRSLELYERLEQSFPQPMRYRRDFGFNHYGMAGHLHDLTTTYVMLGDVLAKTERLQEAEMLTRRCVPILERLIREHPTVPSYSERLAACQEVRGLQLLRLGRSSEGEAALRVALGLRLELAQKQLYDQAIQLLPRAAMHMADALDARGEASESEQVYRQSIAAFDLSKAAQTIRPETLSCVLMLQFDFVERLVKHRHFDEAVRVGDEALKTMTAGALEIPKESCYEQSALNAFISYGTALRAAGQFERLLTHCSLALAHWPDNARLLRLRGGALLSLGKFQEALTDFSHAIEAGPNESFARWGYLERSQAYQALQQPEAARADLDRAIERWPNLSDSWVWRGNFHQDSGHWLEAVSDYSKALELNPNYGPGWQSRALAYSKLGRWQDALSDC